MADFLHIAFVATIFFSQAQAADFGACVSGLRPIAAAKGVTLQTFTAATGGLEADPAVIEALENQPEFKTPIWDYLAGLVDAERIADGLARIEEWAPVLAQAERRFGVDRRVIVAIWGVESDYGRTAGKRSVVRSLATLSCLGSRQRYFRTEFVAALQVLQNGDVAPESLVGSWAGAFGHTQFMPSTFLRLAIDFDGDGRRDIVNSVPDVIGSTAHYLSRAGWVAGAPWGYEVRVPPGYAGASGRRNKHPISYWKSAGLQRIDGTALAGTGPAALLLPAGSRGPAFLVLRNFDAIHSYNASESYALAIAHLTDRLAGERPFVTPWPTDDRGLSRAERREVQERLIERGHDVGAADGHIGPRTRAAIRQLEETAGLPPSGRAGGLLLDALRSRAPLRPPAGPGVTR
jgi:lytic murein transglycosylase